ncbi:MAG: ABC transporter permease, partial [Flavitalea sp.]
MINIFGLATGLATCLLITLFVTDELGYDTFNEKGSRIFRLNTDIHISDNSFKSLSAPAPMAITLLNDYPGIEKVVRINNSGDMLVKKEKENETIMEHGSAFADSTFFEIFTLPLIAGDPKTALKEPKSIVISESMAKKYFGSTDVIGKSLLTSNVQPYKITGVMKDMPSQSHFHFHFLKAMSEMEDSKSSNWLGNNYTTYILARPGINEKDIDGYLTAIVNKYIGPQVQSILHSTLKELTAKGDYFKYASIPLSKIHLYSNYPQEFEPNGNVQYVYIFIIVAIFILLIACVNFMNLSTARSAGRSKEVGVRKALGSQRSNLILQFLSESVLTSFLSLVIAVALAALLLPYFNQ